MKLAIRIVTAPLACLLAMLMIIAGSACGGEDTYGTDVPPGPTRTPRPDATASSPGGQGETAAAPTEMAPEATRPDAAATPARGAHEMLLLDFKIEPFLLDLGTGGQLTVRSMGALTHTFAIYRDPLFTDRLLDAGKVAPGASVTLDVSLSPGTYYARCEIHPLQMRAALTIE